MYIRWKTLFGLGTIFWISLCLYDAYFINPTTKFLYSTTDEYEWLNQVSQEEIVEEDAYPVRDDIKFPFEGYNFGISLLLWNLLAFVLTFVICSVGKISLIYFMEWQAKYSRAKRLTIGSAYEAIMSKRISLSSKIPVYTSLTGSKTSITLLETVAETNKQQPLEESTASLISSSSNSMEVDVRLSKSEMSSRLEQQMEKQCAKLRDEMILVQANSLKEHAALSRKLESVSREKRDLYRQLVTTQKENRAAKEQLEELLGEKTLLVKRLECASKEFKTNTKSKKVALANLEQSQVTISSLKQELEKISQEKDILQNKFKILDAEYKNLKERLAKYEPLTPDSRNSKLDNNNDCFEPKQVINNNVTKDNKRSHLTEISQSQKEVQRVQMRLMNLEKSLDRLKVSNWTKKTENKMSPNSTSDVQEQNHTTTDTDEFDNFVASITTRAESPLECQRNKSENKSTPSDNLTDEQRRRILEPVDSSGDEYSTASKNCDSFMEHEEDPFERMGNLLNFVKGSQASHYDKIAYDTTTSPNEDDTTDDCEPITPKRIVSNSPAFQKFLMKMDPSDRINKKFIA